MTPGLLSAISGLVALGPPDDTIGSTLPVPASDGGSGPGPNRTDGVFESLSAILEIELLLGDEMFGWFARKRDKAKPLMSEAKWLVECDGDFLRATDEQQGVKQLAKSALTGVIIETNDSGPWGVDVWWLLFGADDQVAVAYPQGATGEDAMLTYLMSLPGFDNEKMTDAMRSTDNAVFPVWRRPR